MATPRLTRRQWGAAPVPPGRPTRVDTMLGTALHYVGGSLGPVRHDRCAEILRSIQRDHMAGEYYDIAYNEAACRHGVRFELRGYNVQPGANGTATANRTRYAILALVGAGDTLPLALLEALEDAFDAYRAHGAGAAVTGHRDHKATTCPGNALYALVRAGRFAPKPPPPPPPPPVPLTEELDEMLVRVTGTDPVYVTDGLTRRHLPTAQALADYRAARKASGLPAQPIALVPTEARAAAAFGPIVNGGTA